MEIERDDRLDEEAARFGLVRHCEECVLYDEERDRCAHGYPTEPHKRSASRKLVVFCKDFEAA
ncbi:MAG: hypothetical protein U0234_05775 [Sandaracinus sp.]